MIEYREYRPKFGVKSILAKSESYFINKLPFFEISLHKELKYCCWSNCDKRYQLKANLFEHGTNLLLSIDSSLTQSLPCQEKWVKWNVKLNHYHKWFKDGIDLFKTVWTCPNINEYCEQNPQYDRQNFVNWDDCFGVKWTLHAMNQLISQT